jgi:hypothetical protein
MGGGHPALIKKKIKFSSYIRKFTVAVTKSKMRKGFLIYEKMRKYLSSSFSIARRPSKHFFTL